MEFMDAISLDSVQPWSLGPVLDFDLYEYANSYRGYSRLGSLLFLAKLLPHYAFEAYEEAARTVKSKTLNSTLLGEIRKRQKLFRIYHAHSYTKNTIQRLVAESEAKAEIVGLILDDRNFHEKDEYFDEDHLWIEKVNLEYSKKYSKLTEQVWEAQTHGPKNVVRQILHELGECHVIRGSLSQALNVFNEALTYCLLPDSFVTTSISIIQTASLIGDHAMVIKAVEFSRSEKVLFSNYFQNNDEMARVADFMSKKAGEAFMALGLYSQGVNEFSKILLRSLSSEQKTEENNGGCDLEVVLGSGSMSGLPRTSSLAAAMEAATGTGIKNDDVLGTYGFVSAKNYNEDQEINNCSLDDLIENSDSPKKLLKKNRHSNYCDEFRVGEYSNTEPTPLANYAARMALCMMASVNGNELRGERCWQLQVHDDLEPVFREILIFFIERRYGDAFSRLAKMRNDSPRFELLFQQNGNQIQKSVHRHGLSLFVQPYSAVPFEIISKKLSINNEELTNELEELISVGELQGRLDIATGVLHATCRNKIQETYNALHSCGEAVLSTTKRVILSSTFASTLNNNKRRSAPEKSKKKENNVKKIQYFKFKENQVVD